MTVPMRVTIIPTDSFCSVDGVGFGGVDMTSVAPEVHAVQWYGTSGELELNDPLTGKMIRNDNIESLDAFQSVLDSYWEIRGAEEAAAAEAEQQATLIEV